ncbi:MAG: hypothetical protein Q7U74_15490 [Saprospiraceae bacterium]|nr:hypothetical protein [Saprospiraceae bacterium]
MHYGFEEIAAALFGALVAFIAGPYYSALVIAVLATACRQAFESPGGISSIRRFAMALFVTSMVFHIGAYLDLDKHLAIICAGFFGVFAKEALTVAQTGSGPLFKKLISRVL